MNRVVEVAHIERFNLVTVLGTMRVEMIRADVERLIETLNSGDITVFDSYVELACSRSEEDWYVHVVEVERDFNTELVIQLKSICCAKALGIKLSELFLNCRVTVRKQGNIRYVCVNGCIVIDQRIASK